ncbi:MAG: UDP-N-acetylglucosamine 1-carboxyvinyltransferase [Acetomicrobium sp.]|nr:UDP-N-acetylglucosamine 1-carboxyvinyltransferase [Acetomicrobium sp.]
MKANQGSGFLKIKGGTPLKGKVKVQGSKNAALPVMAAALLLDNGEVHLRNVPKLLDVQTMSELLVSLGAVVERNDHTMTIEIEGEPAWETPSSLVRKMRASSLVLGPLLARCGRVILPLPGGCAIGSRPMDLHFKGLSKMGAQIELDKGAVIARADKLVGARIYLDFPSVGATENLLMAAVLAKGETLIENAAREPEIDNLVRALKSMGAAIEGEGTGILRVRGQKELNPATIDIIPDRIEAATYLLAGAITRGDVTVKGVVAEHLNALLAKLDEAGIEVINKENELRVNSPDRPRGLTVKTMPYPGFSTDLQPQMMALLSLAEGTSVIYETIFESRFLHASELQKMGAQIELQGNTAIIHGQSSLIGAEVYATDLRGGAALVLAGLAAEGETVVYDVHHLDRGYENMAEKLTLLGAEVCEGKDKIKEGKQ